MYYMVLSWSALLFQSIKSMKKDLYNGCTYITVSEPMQEKHMMFCNGQH